MDTAAEAAVGTGHDVFLADEFSERDDAIGCRSAWSTSFAAVIASPQTLLNPQAQFTVYFGK
jgi:hypothetical protein